jgi:adenylate cyclase
MMDFGVAQTTTAARASTIRALNFILLVVCLMTVIGGVAGSVRISLAFGPAAIIFLLLYVICILLNEAGFHDVARFAGIVATALHYGLLCAAMGPQSGMDFFAVGLAFAPIMLFIRSERRKVVGAYTIFATSFGLMEVYRAFRPPIFSLPEHELALSRVIVLIQMTGFTALVVWYYRSAAIAAQVELYRTNERLRELLVNTLPALIADRLQRGERVIADSHAEATVLFADLVGFSELSKRLSPPHLVELLNNLFSQFDEAAAQHGVEKIKTIGDCYMAASGVLGSSGNQVDAMADFAFEMLRIVHALGEQSGLPLDLRIGISTGPVISGVIGRRKYAYDLWGDTVNLASRMESDGRRGHIQVTEATYWRLCKRYRLERRGEMNVKGHPNTVVYDLLRPIEPEPNVLSPDAKRA